MPFPSTEQLSRRKKMRHETPDCRLAGADRCPAAQIPVGIFLVSIENASFRRQAQKPWSSGRTARGHRACTASPCSEKILHNRHNLHNLF